MPLDPVQFGRLEERANLLLKILDEHSAEDRLWHERIDNRLRRIEEQNNHSAGRQSMIASLVGLVAGAIAGYIGRHLG